MNFITTPLLIISTIQLSVIHTSNCFTVLSQLMTSSGRKTQWNMKENQSADDNFFKHKNILLTGASSGLGRSLAGQFILNGASKLVLSGRKKDNLMETKQMCLDLWKETFGEEVRKPDIPIITCDLAKKEDVQVMCDKIKLDHGDIDVLVNNGGLSSRSRFIDTDIDVDEMLMQVNFLSGAALAKAVVPGMMKRAGSTGSKYDAAIIWISSVQGLLGIPNRSSYAASKFAVQGYCESIRAELAPSNILVSVVSPGYIRTNLSKSAITGNGELYNKEDANTLNGADPDDVAKVIVSGVSVGKTDIIVNPGVSASIGLWIRFLLPSVFQNLMVKRYEKSLKE